MIQNRNNLRKKLNQEILLWESKYNAVVKAYESNKMDTDTAIKRINECSIKLYSRRARLKTLYCSSYVPKENRLPDRYITVQNQSQTFYNHY